MKNCVIGIYNDKKLDLKVSMKMFELYVFLEYCILKIIFIVYKFGKSFKGCLILWNFYSINVIVIDCNCIMKVFFYWFFFVLILCNFFVLR